jgi:AmmeMemoRadiSam system protein A
MIASERLGASQAKVLDYANSGDVPAGDKTRVVGYGAVAFVKPQARCRIERGALLSQCAREGRVAQDRPQVRGKRRARSQAYEYSPVGFEALAQERGAFVTLKEHGQLRGCIGYVAPFKPLCITVRDVAAFAALRDTRFNPVSAGELGALEYEISVLSPLRRVLDVKEIRVGEHGLIMKRGETEGSAAPPGSGRRKVGPRHLSRGDLLQGRSAQELLAECRHRHLPLHRAGLSGPPNEPPSPPAPGSPSQPAPPF